MGMFDTAKEFNGDISMWDVSNVLLMKSMFKNTEKFNVDISEWNVSNVKTMSRMFRFSNFDMDISEWDVSNVQKMELMFDHAEFFNHDLSIWDISKVENMKKMFNSATSMKQNLCWDLSNANERDFMFQKSPGTISKKCNKNKEDKKDSPNNKPLKEVKNDTPNDKPLKEVKNDSPKVKPFDFPVMAPTNVPTQYPSSSPTRSMNDIPDPNKPEFDSKLCYSMTDPSFINKEFEIRSGLSSENQQWCLFPSNNVLTEGNKLVLSKCQTWKSYQWKADEEGKLHNVRDPSFCMHMQHKRIYLSKCKNGLWNQQWNYSLQHKLSTRNGMKRAVVESQVGSEKELVRYLPSKKNENKLMDSEIWDLTFVYNTSKAPILSMTIPFQIISGLTTDKQNWCMYPTGNYLDNKRSISLTVCRKWDTIQWTMDTKGKILNFRDSSKCLTRSGKNLVIQDCTQRNSFQSWNYDFITQKLSIIKNSKVAAVVLNSEASKNLKLNTVNMNKESLPICQSSWVLKNV